MDVLSTEKICTKCKVIYPINCFYKKASGFLYSQCKICTNNKNKSWRKKNKDKVRGYNKTWDDKNKEKRSLWAKKLLSRYRLCKNSAKDRSYCFDLTITEFENITNKPCYYCNRFYKNSYSGIDRFNNDVGYIIENCFPCCIICNRAKNSLNCEEFKEWIKCVYKNFCNKE